MMNGNYQADVVERYTSIQHNRAHSEKVISDLRQKLESVTLPDGVLCVAVCGSYARLEACQHSDLDFMIICNSGISGNSIREQIHAVMDELGLPKPNPRGVFSSDCYRENIIKVAGAVDESYGDLSRRLLLLLESKPLIGTVAFSGLVDEITNVYSRDIGEDKKKNFVYLLNDLIRYFRTICVNYQHAMGEEWGKWPIRNIKLRHSRVLMYFSLIACLGRLSTYYEDDKIEKLKYYIKLTPLERLHEIYSDSNDTNFFRFAGSYDLFLQFLSDDKSRERLKNLEYKGRYKCRDFSALKTNSDALAAEITRFIFARRNQWSDRFFEYLFI